MLTVATLFAPPGPRAQEWTGKCKSIHCGCWVEVGGSSSRHRPGQVLADLAPWAKVVQTVVCSTFTRGAKPATRRVADGERMNPQGKGGAFAPGRDDEHQGDEGPMTECDCHEWYEVTKIGEWTQGSAGGPLHARPIHEIVATDNIWERSETDHETLLAEVRESGGINCEYALLATTYLDGHIGLNNGVHRWAIASELGIERIPVEMQNEQEEAAWPSWDLSL